jgi:hypothetical protein
MYVGKPLLENILCIPFTNFEESFLNDHAGHRRHMDGIYRVVELRGGIDSLRASSPTLYWRVILYSPKHPRLPRTRC